VVVELTVPVEVDDAVVVEAVEVAAKTQGEARMAAANAIAAIAVSWAVLV